MPSYAVSNARVHVCEGVHLLELCYIVVCSLA